MNDGILLTALGATIFLGAVMQRVSGMGFALVASPFLVALLGPFEGILVINLFGALASFVILQTVWRDVAFKKAGLILIPAAVATIPGAVVAQFVPSAVLATGIGALVLVTLVGSFFLQGNSRVMGRGGALTAGAVSGFMNVTAGVGGPAVSAYAIATRWPQREFAATAQLYFCALGAISLLAKHALPSLSWQSWVVCAAALAVGVGLGHFFSHLVSASTARVMVVVLAFVGASLIIVKGIVELST